MMFYVERRAAVNVEYIILIVAGALAVTLGLGYLGNTMNAKHIQVAEALITTAATDNVGGTLVSDAPVDNGDGTYTISWSGGIAPFTVTDGTNTLADAIEDYYLIVTPEQGVNTYTITDSVLNEITVTVVEYHSELRVTGSPASQLIPDELGTSLWFAPTLTDNWNVNDWAPLLWTTDNVKVRARELGGNLTLDFASDPDVIPAGYPGAFRRLDIVVVVRAAVAPLPSRTLTVSAETSTDVIAWWFLDVPSDALYHTYRMTIPSDAGFDLSNPSVRDALAVRLEAECVASGLFDVESIYLDYVYE
ncbi:MAG: hypothetical protein CVT67_02945 [Actinobacteria bacterium HGW-Actinobacteria-7]|nr:MAG: hypothetical protein CVT67_02945 [Actinobacteria bacterium HGW-Actinobacteria-7]